MRPHRQPRIIGVMTAEAIARTIRYFARGEVLGGTEYDRVAASVLPHAEQVKLVAASTIVDVTALYRQIQGRGEGRDVYRDHVFAPPWESASYCWVSARGQVFVAHVYTDLAVDLPSALRWESTSGTHSIDWDSVKWASCVLLWVGETTGDDGVHRPPFGPIFGWTVAVADAGEIIDVRWIEMVPLAPEERLLVDSTALYWLGAVNFLNCRNVEAVEPVRPRGERRRLERLGVRVHEINVLPIGKTGRSRSRGESLGVPLASVRGHFAAYGQDGKGLLFGKYSGRFWIPQHARGSAEHGVIDQSFTVAAPVV